MGLAPDRAAAHSGLAFAYSQSERYEEAIQAYLEAVRLQPDGWTYSSLGQTYAKLGRYREALDAFAEAIRLAPEDPHVTEELGDLYSELGYYAKALDAYSKALRLATGRDEGAKPRFHYLLGKTYLDLGNRSSALEEYKILKSLDAQYAEMLFNSIYK